MSGVRRWQIAAIGGNVSAMLMNAALVVFNVLGHRFWLVPINGLAAVGCGALGVISYGRYRRGIQQQTDTDSGVPGTSFANYAAQIAAGTASINALGAVLGASAGSVLASGGPIPIICGLCGEAITPAYGATLSFALTPDRNVISDDSGRVLHACTVSPPAIGEPVDDYAVGWREWTVQQPVGEPVELHALVMNDNGPWASGGWTKARCRMATHPTGEPVPSAECTCGLHVRSDHVHTPAAFVPGVMLFTALGRPSPDGRIIGVVLAKGRIIEHGSEGFRAEYARPLALAADVNPAMAQLAAEAYEIPLLPLAELPAYAVRYGRQISDDQGERRDAS